MTAASKFSANVGGIINVFSCMHVIDHITYVWLMECGCNFWPNKKIPVLSVTHPATSCFCFFFFFLLFQGKLKQNPPERIKEKNERKEMSGKTLNLETRKKRMLYPTCLPFHVCAYCFHYKHRGCFVVVFY